MWAAGQLLRKCSERDEATSVRLARERVESDTSIVRSNSGSDITVDEENKGPRAAMT